MSSTSPAHHGRPQGRGIRASRGTDALLSADSRFLWTHLWLPLLAFAAAIAVIALLQLDWALAHRLYAWEGYRWVLKKAFLTEAVLHRSGHDLSVAAWVGVLAAWLAALKRDSLAVWRKPLGYLTLSILVSTLLISWIKSWSNMDCPWDIEGLGGVRPYVELFAPRPASLLDGRCFPAGHASGGYAWMSLYFFCLLSRPRLRWLGLAAGLGAGLVFGIGQQLRGAHFLSHDLWTAMLCWLVAFGLYFLFRAPVPARLRSRRARIARHRQRKRETVLKPALRASVAAL